MTCLDWLSELFPLCRFTRIAIGDWFGARGTLQCSCLPPVIFNHQDGHTCVRIFVFLFHFQFSHDRCAHVVADEPNGSRLNWSKNGGLEKNDHALSIDGTAPIYFWLSTKQITPNLYIIHFGSYLLGDPVSVRWAKSSCSIGFCNFRLRDAIIQFRNGK